MEYRRRIPNKTEIADTLVVREDLQDKNITEDKWSPHCIF
jgi:hypothetical protein